MAKKEIRNKTFEALIKDMARKHGVRVVNVTEPGRSVGIIGGVAPRRSKTEGKPEVRPQDESAGEGE